MNIHEYQAKALLHAYGAPVAEGHVAETPEEAAAHAQTLGGETFVVKAQIHAGGRGKGGGIKLVKTLQELHAEADRMLGKPLITPQTGPKGRVVRRIYVVKDATIAREFYLSLLVDRDSGRVAFVASTEGGVNIEEVAANTPEKIVTLTVDPASGISDFHGRVIASALKLQGPLAKQCAALVKSLYTLFVEKDASLIEINPLVVTKDNNLLCLDAKIGFDDNALFRHKDIASLRDIHEEDPAEVEAADLGLSYVKLDGSIGCLVNGAGLAMSTMDIIKLYGGEPANFLDVGGGASKERVAEAFKIILSDPHVKGVLVNIFGGIMRCDTIAEGIIAAAREMHISVPLVVRLEGTNVERGKALLRDSGLHWRPRHVPLRAGHCLWHQDGRRRDAGQRRYHASRPSGVRHRERGGVDDRRRRERDLCAAGLRRRCHPRSDRRRRAAGRLHHRRRAGAGHGQGQARAVRLGNATDRPELPGRHYPRSVQDRHHAGPYP
jgi:succinyl-CoA synthetase beta subunit